MVITPVRLSQLCTLEFAQIDTCLLFSYCSCWATSCLQYRCGEVYIHLSADPSVHEVGTRLRTLLKRAIQIFSSEVYSGGISIDCVQVSSVIRSALATSSISSVLALPPSSSNSRGLCSLYEFHDRDIYRHSWCRLAWRSISRRILQLHLAVNLAISPIGWASPFLA